MHANVLQLGDASWGGDYDITANCDGNPIMDLQANLVLSDEDSPYHEPDAAPGHWWYKQLLSDCDLIDPLASRCFLALPMLLDYHYAN